MFFLGILADILGDLRKIMTSKSLYLALKASSM